MSTGTLRPWSMRTGLRGPPPDDWRRSRTKSLTASPMFAGTVDVWGTSWSVVTIAIGVRSLRRGRDLAPRPVPASARRQGSRRDTAAALRPSGCGTLRSDGRTRGARGRPGGILGM